MRFTKMQGVGNDFVVVDEASGPPNKNWSAFAIRVCDRHIGVGADGLLTVREGGSARPFSMRMFNPDGTEDMCGNGLRCCGLWAYRAGWVGIGAPFMVGTKEGDKAVTLRSVAPDGRSAVLTVDMGVPRFRPAEVPFCVDGVDGLVDFPLAVGPETVAVTSLNTGSTHTVILGDPPDEERFQRISPAIELHRAFPERTSVMWATPAEPNAFDLRIWERGAGETLGCGSGACAVAVAARLCGLASDDAAVTIRSRGGTLHVEREGESHPMVMTGPAAIVYDGEFAETGMSEECITTMAQPASAKPSFDKRFDMRSFGEPLKALRAVPIVDRGEPLVDLREYCPTVLLRPGSLPFLRETVAGMVNEVQRRLPDGHTLYVGTCLRTMQNQRDIRERFLKEQTEQHPEWTKSTLNRILNRMIAPPDDVSPPPHTTGGALDVGVHGPEGEPLDFRTPIEGWAGAPTYCGKLSEVARRNRLLLIEAMEGAGLTNYVGEWWHWSYGDQGWALRVGSPVAYYGYVELEDAESKRIPVPEEPIKDNE